MQLSHGIHLAYCTNVHRGGSWEETFSSLEGYVMRVRREVAPDQPYAIGLRLGVDAANELSDGDRLHKFATVNLLSPHDLQAACAAFARLNFRHDAFFETV